MGDRLPALSEEDSAKLRGSFDFVGFNHYLILRIQSASSSKDSDHKLRDYYVDAAVQSSELTLNHALLSHSAFIPYTHRYEFGVVLASTVSEEELAAEPFYALLMQIHFWPLRRYCTVQRKTFSSCSTPARIDALVSCYRFVHATSTLMPCAAAGPHRVSSMGTGEDAGAPEAQLREPSGHDP